MGEQTNTIQKQQQPEPKQDIVKDAREVANADIYSIDEAVDDGGKLDWFYTRLQYPSESTKNLAITLGNKSFDKLKTADEYWDDPKVKEKFTAMYGEFGAKVRFDQFYDIALQDFSQFQLGKHRRSQTATELYIKDTDRLRTDITRRFENLPGTYSVGKEYSGAQYSFRERLDRVREPIVDANGNVTFKYYDYTADIYNFLIGEDDVSGLAYGDVWANHGGNDGVYGAYMDVIKEGQIYDDNLGKMVDVRNDQIISRLDLKTGSAFDGLLQNNKLQADSIGDYIGAIVKSPLNMISGLVDTGIQALRISTALSYGAVNLFKSDELDLKENEFFKELTKAGIYVKSFTGSHSDYAMKKGIFRSFEMSLSTVFDLAMQIGVARALGGATSFTTRKLLAGSLSKGAVRALEQKAANHVVRSTLTAFAAKDSYNSAKEIGFTDSEAAIYSAVSFVALWQATRFAGYITGEYDIRVTRKKIQDIIKRELDDAVAPAFRKLNQTAANTGGKALTSLNETKGKMSLSKMTGKMNAFVKGITSKTPNSRMAFESQQEALEEMSEELAQDIVGHGASAYGVLMKDAKKAGDGRFKTIFDDGYFLEAIERYAASGLMGGIAGPMGMMFSTNLHNEITDTANIIDIIASGRESELVDVLNDMKNAGELGPTDLSLTYNEQLKTFEPILKGQKIESLGDMTYNSYIHDINIVKTFISTGLNGKALQRIQEDKLFSEQLNSTSMRKDFINSASSLLALHQRTGLSTSIEKELDDLTEAELEIRIPEIVKEHTASIDNRRKEIEELKKRISKTTPDREGGGKKNPGTLKPEVVKKRYGTEEEGDRVSRLNKELETLNSVSNDDIVELFSLYRKIRGIAQGTAAESYLMQYDLFDDKIFGNIETRDSEWTKLGDAPFIELMHKATLRSLDDEKEFLKKGRKAADTTKKIRAITEFTPESIKELSLLFAENPKLITREALEHLSKKYDVKKHLGPLLKAFNISTPGSLLTDEKGNYDSNKARVLMHAVAKLGDKGKTINTPDVILDSAYVSDHEIKKLFNEFKSDPEGFKLFNVTEFGIMDVPVKLLDVIEKIEHEGFQKIFNTIDKSVFTLRRLGNNAALNLKEKQYYNPNDFERGNVNVLFRTLHKEQFTNKTLLEDGLGEVIDLISNPRSSGKDGQVRYSKKSYGKIDTVLEDIKLREKMTEVITKFINKGQLLKYAPILKAFRKNVIDIIDQKYDVDEAPDTTKERHAYKDYTAFSDFFTDFIFNPIEFDVIKGMGDPQYLTDGDKKALKKFELASVELQASRVIKNADGSTVHVPVDIDYEQLEIELLKRFNNLDSTDDFEEALAMFNESYIQVPASAVKGNITGPVLVAMGNMFRLKASEFLLKKAKYYIQQSSGHSSELPYIEDKNEHIKKDFRSLNNVLTGDSVHEDDQADKKYLEDLRSYVVTELPEYSDISIAFLANKIDYVKLGKFNIKLEKLFYNLFNENIPELNKGDINQENIKQAVLNIANNGPMSYGGNFNEISSEEGYSNLVLIGAITTDFTEFYSLFKGKLENAKDTDDIPIAAQELSAKYAAAFVYSKGLKDYLNDNREKEEYLNAVFIGGAAGTGKSTAAISLGLDIAIDIIKNQNEKNKSAVASVSNHDIQIKILERSVAEKSQGIPGKTFDDFFETVRKAVVDGDVIAKAELDKIGVVVIDEVTYVIAEKNNTVDNETSLEVLSEMLEEYNRDRETNIISVITMGDQNQSSAVSKKSSSKAGIRGGNVFALPYMSFSMRARNSFLVEGLSMIKTMRKNLPDPFSGKDVDFLVVTGKTKYGTLDGRHYGMNLMKAEEDGNGTFLNIVKDKNLLDDIKKNLDSDEDFDVIFGPESIEDFNSSLDNNKQLKNLINDYPGRVNVIKALELGGSEASYVIAEVPKYEGELGYNRSSAMFDRLNTIATRAKNFTILAIKDNTIILPGEFASERTSGVMIPDISIDLEDKKSYIKHHLEILEDVNTAEVTQPVDEDDDSDDGDDSTLKEDMITITDSLFDKDNSILSEDSTLDIYNSLNNGETKPEIEDQSAVKLFLENAYSASASYSGITNELTELLKAYDVVSQRTNIPKELVEDFKNLYDHIVNVINSDFDGKEDVMDDIKDRITTIVDIIDDNEDDIKADKFRADADDIFRSVVPTIFNSDNIESIFNELNKSEAKIEDPLHIDNKKQASIRSFIDKAYKTIQDRGNSKAILDDFKKSYIAALNQFPDINGERKKDIEFLHDLVISLKFSDDFIDKSEILDEVGGDLSNLLDIIKPAVSSGGNTIPPTTDPTGNDDFKNGIVKMVTAYKGNKYILGVLENIINDFNESTVDPFKSDGLNESFNKAMAENWTTIETVKKEFLASIKEVSEMDFSSITVNVKKPLSKKDKKYKKLIKGIKKLDTIDELSEIDEAITGKKVAFSPDDLNILYDELSDVYKINELKKEVRAEIGDRIKKLKPKGGKGAKKGKPAKKKKGVGVKAILNKQSSEMEEYRLLIRGITDLEVINGIIYNINGLKNKQATDARFNNEAIPDDIRELLRSKVAELESKNYLISHIKNVMGEIAKEQKLIINPPTPIADAKSEAIALSIELGLGVYKNDFESTYHLLVYRHLELLNDNTVGPSDEIFEKINRLYELLHDTLLSKDSKSNFFNKFTRVTPHDEASLENYIKEAENNAIRNEIFTVASRHTGFPFVNEELKNLGYNEIGEDNKYRIFGLIDGSSGNVPKNLEVVFVKKHAGRLEAYIAVEADGKKYIISQVFTGKVSNVDAAGNRSEIRNVAGEAFLSKGNKLFDESNKKNIINVDAEYNGEVITHQIAIFKPKRRVVMEELLHLRPGKIIKTKGGSMNTISQLKASDKNLSISDSMYVINNPALEGGLKNQQSFFLYVKGKDINLDSEDVIKQINKGTLENNKYIKIKYKGVTLSVGILPVDVNISFDKMGDYVRANTSYKVPEFSNMFSIMLTVAVYDKVKKLKGDTFKDIKEAYKNYNESQINRARGILRKINKDGSSRNVLNTIVDIHITTMKEGAEQMDYILKRKKGNSKKKNSNNTMVLNFEKIFMINDPEVNKALDELAKYANYTFKPPYRKSGGKTDLYKQVEPKFSSFFLNNFVLNIGSIENGEFVLSGKILKIISTGSKIVRKNINVYDTESDNVKKSIRIVRQFNHNVNDLVNNVKGQTGNFNTNSFINAINTTILEISEALEEIDNKNFDEKNVNKTDIIALKDTVDALNNLLKEIEGEITYDEDDIIDTGMSDYNQDFLSVVNSALAAQGIIKFNDKKILTLFADADSRGVKFSSNMFDILFIKTDINKVAGEDASEELKAVVEALEEGGDFAFCGGAPF